MTNIILEYSYWWLIIIFAVAFLYSFLLYKNDDSFSDIKKYVLILLKSFRFTLVFILLFFLLKPLLKNTDKTIEKPIVAFLQDNSTSLVQSKDSLFLRNNYKQRIRNLTKELGDNYDFVFYKFSGNIEKKDSFNFLGSQTNIENALNKINKLYSNRNIGAIVLASDGIYNKGANPVYSNYSLNAPIYTIGIGDSINKKDIAISNLIYNKTVFLGNSFPLIINITAKKLLGEKTKIKILSDGKIIEEKEILINNINFDTKYNFKIPAEEKGVKRYTVIVDSLPNETNIENNKKDFIVEVVDSKKQILIIANSPHPDISAIRKSLETTLLYNVDYFQIDEEIDDLKKYDLLILHQIPSKKRPATNLLSKIDNYNIPILSILGAQADIKKYNKQNTGITIKTQINSYEETSPILNKNFSYFTVNDAAKDFYDNLPPLISNFADYKLNGKNDILLYQKIKNIETQKPLVVFTENAGKKHGLITGEGIWRWRINDYKLNNSFDNFDNLIKKTVQYLCANIKNETFIVEHKVEYRTNENIRISAKLYNKSFEPVNSAEVKLTIKNKDGKFYNYIFEKYYDSYKINLGKLPEGDYLLKAETELGSDKYTKTSSFSVVKTNIESLNTVANFDLLKQISSKFGGAFFNINEIENLKNEIENNKNITSVSHSQDYLSEIINNIWFFILLITLASAEWIIRKYSGSY